MGSWKRRDQRRVWYRKKYQEIPRLTKREKEDASRGWSWTHVYRTLNKHWRLRRALMRTFRYVDLSTYAAFEYKVLVRPREQLVPPSHRGSPRTFYVRAEIRLIKQAAQLTHFWSLVKRRPDRLRKRTDERVHTRFAEVDVLSSQADHRLN